MPAMLEDPSAPPLQRVSGAAPYPTPTTPLPSSIVPIPITLRDSSPATLLPFSSPLSLPPALLAHLSAVFNGEIARGDTYPMIDAVPLDRFGPYWFGNFGAVMLAGKWEGLTAETEADWEAVVLGSFYIKPNYPGRSSHVANGGFLVTEAARGKGVGRKMGEAYVKWAPQLGYTYSIFNLVYETNIASMRIWDALGFERVGRVKGCGALKSHPGRLIDAIVFGRELKIDESKP
ncbi:hypothetical protein K461DRAFT_250409 [Myriangium duriaei CBS 260.36]|uniref:N-acetyltransferase domain-containing protein n=1 Tax=Myriangium duriaei CBS 260.36 TaxID=1168546 RepID=A0A9P4MPN4_9PEZI|nr:hypothetical protein K461DRAFT_250409 [Myriangium duriaei CBS 260.36]